MRSPLLRLVRPSHWVKNVFVLAPLLFSGTFRDPAAAGRTLFAALLFCVAASLVYVVNDLRDVEEDRRHPVKRQLRPVASGSVSVPTARAVAAALLALLLLGVAAAPRTGAVVCGYVVVNLAYSFGLKRVPVVELFGVASGFVLRVWAGAVAAQVPLSALMVATTLCLALYLAVVKRKQEIGSTASGGGRAVLGAYSPALLDRYGHVAASGAVAFYGLWVVELRPELMLTLPLVLFAFFRYDYLVDSRDLGECPTDAFWRDPSLLLTAGVWCGAAVWAMW